MDILSLLRTVRRHWLLVLPVALLTIAGLVWAVVVKDPAYDSTTTVTLLAPPAPPIDDDGQPVTRTEDGSTDNPLTRFGDQAVIVNRVSRAVSTDANRRALAAAGAAPDFEVETGNGPEAIINAERDLNVRFRNGHVDDESLSSMTREIGALYGELRYTHLRAHLATRRVLTDAQVAEYERLRGYTYPP